MEMALEMEVEETGKGGEGGDGTQMALGDLEFRTQDAEMSGTNLNDACNVFNELMRLAMLCTVRHRWLTGARFAFNCYRHWAQLVLHQSGEPTITTLIREGVTQGDLLLMVLYRITLIPLAEELRAVDLGILSPFTWIMWRLMVWHVKVHSF